MTGQKSGSPQAHGWACNIWLGKAFLGAVALLLLQPPPLIAQQQVPSGMLMGVDDNEARDESGSSQSGRDAAPPATAPPPPSMTPPLVRREIEGQRADDREENVPLEIPSKKAPPAPPNEFERYVTFQLGRALPRFGANLLVPGTRDFSVPATTTVPPSYTINPGDVLAIELTGSIETSLTARVDNEGMVTLPTIGRVSVAGARYADLRSVLQRAVGQHYRRFDLSVSVSRLRGIKVYVTGYANNPGSYTLSSLSTLVNATLAAGGPSAGGSFRSVQLFRQGQLITDFDLYDLLREGDRSNDILLQNDDVLLIPPVGRQVAIAGSVNEEAIYEARTGETLGGLIARFAGGVTSLADDTRVMLYRVDNLDEQGGEQLSMTQAEATLAEAGDIVQVLSIGSLARPLEKQAVLVRVDGEVARPGDYYVQPNTSMGEVMALAGGLTPRAYVFGAKFQRFSVRQQQRESFAEAIQQLELALLSAPLGGDDIQNPAVREGQRLAAREVLERLKQTEPDGRVILSVNHDTPTLPPEMTLENNDHIYIPPRPTTVGVFGSVYRPGSFQIEPGLKVKNLVDMAGGPVRAADRGAIFVVRANGAVVPKSRGALDENVLPGDLVFVPIKSQYSSIWSKIRDISSIIFQLGLGAAAFVAVTQ